MSKLLHCLTGIKVNALLNGNSIAAGWHWHTITSSILPVTSPNAVCVHLALSSAQMSIPVPRTGVMIGRDALIADAAPAVTAGDWSRVLLYGLPGVGKDVVGGATVRDDRVKLFPGLQL